MLPIVDRPLIQYAVDEAREAGIEQIIFVTGRGKTAIVEHFDMAFELETTMDERGKDLSVLDPTRATPGDIITVRQQFPLGLGHAIWCARSSATIPSPSSCPTSRWWRPRAAAPAA